VDHPELAGSEHWQHPEQPPMLVTTAMQGGKELKHKWTHFTDEDYSPEFRSGKVHFLRVTAKDPNEQASVFDMESILLAAQGGSLKPAEWAAMNFDEQEMKQMEVARREAAEFEQVKEWMQSDDPHGLTYKPAPKSGEPGLFPSYQKWKEERQNQKPGK